MQIRITRTIGFVDVSTQIYQIWGNIRSYGKKYLKIINNILANNKMTYLHL